MKEIKEFYQPNVTNIEGLDFTLESVWLIKEKLRDYLFDEGLEHIDILCRNTNAIDFIPIVVDLNEYEWDAKLKKFQLRDINYLKKLFESNIQIIIKEPKKVLDFLFQEDNVIELPRCKESLEVGISIKYKISYKSNQYIAEFINYKNFSLFDTEQNKILELNIKPNIKKTTYSGINLVLNVDQDFFDEYNNEIWSAMEYTNVNNCSITIENTDSGNERFGLGLNNYKVLVEWNIEHYKEIVIDNKILSINTSINDEQIYFILDECEYKIDSFINRCSTLGIDIEEKSIERLIIDTNKFSKDKEWVTFYSDNILIKRMGNKFYTKRNSIIEELTLLPAGKEMEFLNELNRRFKVHMKVWDFKNDTKTFKKDIVLNFKEGENNNSDGVSYVISNLITEVTLNHAIKMTNRIWGFVDVNDYDTTFQDISKTISVEFGMSLEEIFEDEMLPNNWYLIFDNVLSILNVEFEQINSKTFII